MTTDRHEGGAHGRLGPIVAGVLAIAAGLSLGVPARAGQLAALVSPGPLTRAHAALEGLDKCQQCHETGRKVPSERCLTCHKPIAERMAKGAGVHRAVKGECVSCHAEHAGMNADLRRIDRQGFRHAEETGFALDGRHAAVATRCEACHKGRSLLEARPACVSCHADVHKATFGSNCIQCHSTQVTFKAAREQYNHDATRFPLTGKHLVAACAACHAKPEFKSLAFQSCTACHAEPHNKRFGAACTSCHTTEHWTTTTVEHAKTAFPLVGAHIQVACSKCHAAKATVPVKFGQCSACHTNVHRDSVKDGCRACHTEVTFKAATFDHAARTPFPLLGKHAGLECRKCHKTLSAPDVPMALKVLDFGGATRACASCHSDPHKETYGATCENCHRFETFKASNFAHPRSPEFFAGRHTGVACVKCHVPSATAGAVVPVRVPAPGTPPPPPSLACAACHVDPHLGQVGEACEPCHRVDAAKFAPTAFSHDRARFPLTGAHVPLPCEKCHLRETRPYPTRTGLATRLSGLPSDCKSCHTEPHLGQLDDRCETCHATASFKVPSYVHQRDERFFAGFHGRLPCASCHKRETGRFPSGAGTAVRYKVGVTCASCHPQF